MSMRNGNGRGRTSRATRIVLVASLAVAGGLALALPAHAQSSRAAVPVLQLDGVVDPFVADYLQSAIERAADDGAPAVMIEIDTPGGLISSERQITQAILASPIPVIGYVAPQGARAASAGAFVLLSCPVAAMAPGTNVGAATPVGLNGAVGSDKAVNDAAASIRSLAETYGRDPDVAESFVREATSITAEEALDAGMIELIAPSRTQLLADLNGMQVTLANGTSTTLDTTGWVLEDEPMGGFVSFLHGLLDPNLAFIFFWLGLILIVIELIVPGHIFSGTVGTILLILAVISFGVLPVRAIGVILLIVAAIMFFVEASAPGLGVWGAIGLVCLVLGGWFLYDRAGGVEVSPVVLVPVALLVAGFFGLALSKLVAIRHMPPPEGPEAIIGREGVAIGGGLRPGGIVRVASEEWQAVAPDARIPTGARVRVTGIDGLVLTVEPVTDEHAPAATPEGKGNPA
jgi:membrane-bound serine protease (ClpP class)